MFQITYQIIDNKLTNLEELSDEQIQYNFLSGNLILLSDNTKIEMEWEWIPLLDFAYGLNKIIRNLGVNSNKKEHFEFTENAETLKFSREEEQLRISASFSPITISVVFAEFQRQWAFFMLVLANMYKQISLMKCQLSCKNIFTTSRKCFYYREIVR